MTGLQRTPWLGRLFRWRLGPLTVGAALLVALVAGRDVRQPPVWDAAFSVVPSAYLLADSGFDLGEFARQPDYHEGGVGTHGTSLVTISMAVILSLVDGPVASLVALHLLHFAIAAFGLACLVLLATPTLGRAGAALLGASVLLQPAFLVQTGRLYLEIPAFAAAAAALLAWTHRRWALALAACLAAACVKESGVIAPVILALTSLPGSGPRRDRIARSLLFLATAVAGVVVLSASRSEAVSHELLGFGLLPRYGEYLRLNYERYLETAPDLLTLTAGALLLTLARGRWVCRGIFPPAAGESALATQAHRTRTAAAALVIGFVGFHFVALPLIGGYFQLLTRYWIVAMPFALLLLADALRVWRGERAAHIALAMICGLFIANGGGALYPPLPEKFGNDLSIAERSQEYRALVTLQTDATRELERLAAEMPVFYELPVHFLVRDPRLGYVQAPLASGQCILFESPYRDGRLADFPDRFAALYLSPWLGGAQVKSLFMEARRDPTWRVDDSLILRRGPFEARIVKFWRVSARTKPRGAGS